LLLPCIDAGKGQVYARLYDVVKGAVPKAQGESDWVLAPDALCRLVGDSLSGAQVYAGGTGVDRYLGAFHAAFGESRVVSLLPGPSAAAIGRLALDRIRRGDYDDIETAVPRYGRPPDITRPKNALLLP